MNPTLCVEQSNLPIRGRFKCQVMKLNSFEKDAGWHEIADLLVDSHLSINIFGADNLDDFVKVEKSCKPLQRFWHIQIYDKFIIAPENVKTFSEAYLILGLNGKGYCIQECGTPPVNHDGEIHLICEICGSMCDVNTERRKQTNIFHPSIKLSYFLEQYQ